MTITSQDRAFFSETAAEFHTQYELDHCLPTAVKNVLNELADRIDEPKLQTNMSDLNDHLDYREGAAAASDRLGARLDPLLEEHGYETRTMTGTSIEELAGIIDDQSASLPCCDLDPEYFATVDRGYAVESGVDRYGRWPHTVIPFAVNDSSVLYFDPFLEFFADDSESLEMELDQDTLSGSSSGHVPRSDGHSVEPEEQSTLSAFGRQ
ncbi:MAG: hypothetical protein U5K37_12905 [Natrialbaceae archaeon]|nr:hypothetical protein [Natrialbaceae archaeon]